jgi:hypothetical protein
MSDVMPKVKLYVFISIISLIVNVGVILSMLATNEGVSILDLMVGGSTILTAFIPFVSLLPIALLGIPLEIFLFIGIFTTILSVIQTLIITFIVLQVAKNIIWQPDV